jgi:hypothetical protein
MENIYWGGGAVRSFCMCGHTCLAAAEEIVLLCSRSKSSASVEGVTGLAAPRRRERKRK